MRATKTGGYRCDMQVTLRRGGCLSASRALSTEARAEGRASLGIAKPGLYWAGISRLGGRTCPKGL